MGADWQYKIRFYYTEGRGLAIETVHIGWNSASIELQAGLGREDIATAEVWRINQ